jgi:hypothetical protein
MGLTIPRMKGSKTEGSRSLKLSYEHRTTWPTSMCYVHKMLMLWRACNLTSFSPCLTGPVDYPFASRHEGPRFKSPGGDLCETGISPVSVVSQLWWPWHDPITGFVTLKASLSFAPTWWTWSLSSSVPVSRSLQVLLSTLQWTESAAGGSPVESLQSHLNLTMSHWSSGLPVCFPSWGTQVQFPKGYLCETRISPVSVVSLQCGLPYLSLSGLRYRIHQCFYMILPF